MEEICLESMIPFYLHKSISIYLISMSVEEFIDTAKDTKELNTLFRQNSKDPTQSISFDVRKCKTLDIN
jgi:hypothetical protein